MATPSPASALEADGAAPTPGRVARAVVYGSLMFVIVCALFGIEAWPASGFRLFSQVRQPVQSRWVLVSVDERGTERVVSVASLGRSYRQSGHLLPSVPRATTAEQRSMCAAWLHASGEFRLRIYRETLRVQRPPHAPIVTARVLRHECLAGAP